MMARAVRRGLGLASPAWGSHIVFQVVQAQLVHHLHLLLLHLSPPGHTSPQVSRASTQVEVQAQPARHLSNSQVGHHLTTCPPAHLATCSPVHLTTCSPDHLSTYPLPERSPAPPRCG